MLGVGFTAEGHDIIVGGKDATRLLDPETLAVRRTLPGQNAIELSPDSDRLALVDADPNLVKIYDRAAGRELCAIDRGKRSLRFAPAGHTGITFWPYTDGQLQVWDLDAGRLRETVTLAGVMSILDLAFAPDGGSFAVGCQFADMAIYNFAARSWRRRSVAGVELVMVLAVAYSPDGRTVAAGLDSGQVVLLDAQTLAVVGRLEGHGAPVNGLGFAPDGRTIASVGGDLTVRLWDPETAQERLSLRSEQPVRLAFSPDGRTLVNWYDRGSPLWVWCAPRSPLATARRASEGMLDPESPQELEQAGYGYWNSGRPVDAESLFRRALSRLDSAGHAEANEREARGLRAGIRAALGLLLNDAGRHDESAKLVREVVAESGELSRDARHNLALKLIEQFRSLRERQRAASAGAALGLAEEVAPVDDLKFQSMTGVIYALDGLWTQAAARFDSTATLLAAEAAWPLDDEANAGYLVALARLASSDQSGYRKACTRLLERFADSDAAGPLNWFVWACALGPEPVSDTGHLVAAARRLTKLQPADADSYQVAGAALYRAERFDEAARLLDEAAIRRTVADDSQRTTPHYGRILLAMALHRLGRPAAARRALETALTAIDADTISASKPMAWNRRLTFRLLRSEAEATLSRPAGDAPAEQIAAAGPWLDVVAAEDVSGEAGRSSLPGQSADRLRDAYRAQSDEAAKTDRWNEVAASFDRIIDISRDAHHDWYRWTIARAGAGDLDAYRRACRRLLDRFGSISHPVLDERTAKACLVLPMGGTEGAEAIRVAERAVANSQEHLVLGDAQLVRSLAAYRAGDSAAALRWADLCLSEGPCAWNRDVPVRFVRAMALAGLGRTADARATVAKAAAIERSQRPEPGTPEYVNLWHDRLVCDLLRTEANAHTLDAEFPRDPFATNAEVR